mgnify:CR=1 FL=1
MELSELGTGRKIIMNILDFKVGDVVYRYEPCGIDKSYIGTRSEIIYMDSKGARVKRLEGIQEGKNWDVYGDWTEGWLRDEEQSPVNAARIEINISYPTKPNYKDIKRDIEEAFIEVLEQLNSKF